MATYAAYRHIELDNVGYGKKRVLKPPGGGSSDIFGGAPEETSPRRIKNHNHSQLGSTMFGENSTHGSDTPRAKPGNDSYKRLFGPPDAPTTPSSKNHMRSNIPLSGEKSVPETSSQSNTSINGSSNGNIYGNGNDAYNSETAFRRKKRFRGLSCMPRNPVTGDGVDVMPLRRSARRSRDGNPVTGTGYTGNTENNSAPVQNGNGNVSEKVNGSSTGSASPPAPAGQPRTRVPPGGYSSGLW
ncbi:microtubule-associated protein Jupiter isoform X1 [Neodiprion pinetum]|uniref:Microtubule-associated protein Jupiter n=1 Tax=Neodiprion lecontei TaxID=441921 RepID=A0A6J0BFL5_NEOLC|nr:microtubule-associated protein Jupiter isoform X1 [Neodiprion lecontei]XP_046421594.1 microtubule-associated protein Jupiter-like isoform X1 [Neodiprion fabricii]XP_046421595.1 microtubule-associated protein Jupiter-like isoform X1 [Neodiprion fabricii]XP_046421596.1 microtubule-associated protein Jupiter-like isoform X1 [Neodiprion fabricii]XP_046478036.1 microtubule-associated protein Jupiter-like isoform X1 [Neodiprion pinetum]XP_046478037.1 microtubule-associated protein Jupiter-like is